MGNGKIFEKNKNFQQNYQNQRRYKTK